MAKRAIRRSMTNRRNRWMLSERTTSQY
jgi:hypothetical protein